MTDNASIAADIAEMNRLMKVYATFDAESLIAKLLNAEIDRLSDVIEDALKVETTDLVTRLVPAGGMALTAEQVAALKRLMDAQPDEVPQGYDLLEALFPATDPAEEAVGDPLQAWKEFLKPKPIGWYRTMTPQFATEYFGFPDGSVLGQTHTASDGGTWGWCGDDWELLVYPPAPAEPAEEETKAEAESDLDMHPDAVYGREYVEQAKVRRIARAVKECDTPSSSPVVPASTETGPTIDREDRADLRKLADAVVSASDLAHGILGMLDGMDDNDEIHAAPAETEWQTWDAVPDHKPYHGTTENGLLTETTWVNESGVRRAQRPSAYVTEFGDYADYEMHNFAPFVAAEEG